MQPDASPSTSPASAAQPAPLVKRLVQHLLDAEPRRRTLLAVCPNSAAVTRAAVAAAEEAQAPLLLAATLNQVDLDGGYTGWTPADLTAFVDAERQRQGVTVPILPCLDHGGPWLKDAHTSEGLSFDETMAAVQSSLAACIDAGYALLHIDPTVDRDLPPGTKVSPETVVARTVVLIESAEAHRRRADCRPWRTRWGLRKCTAGSRPWTPSRTSSRCWTRRFVRRG